MRKLIILLLLCSVCYGTICYSHLKPDQTNHLDIGTNALKWKDGYFQGTLNATTFVGTNAAYLPLAGGTMTGELVTDGNLSSSGAAIDFSSKNFTGVGTLGCGAITSTGAFRMDYGSGQLDMTIADNDVHLASTDDFIFDTDVVLRGTYDLELLGGNIILADNKKVSLGDDADVSIYWNAATEESYV